MSPAVRFPKLPLGVHTTRGAPGTRSDAWANNARSRVANEFLIFHQVQRWLEVLAELG